MPTITRTGTWYGLFDETGSRVDPTLYGDRGDAADAGDEHLARTGDIVTTEPVCNDHPTNRDEHCPLHDDDRTPTEPVLPAAHTAIVALISTALLDGAPDDHLRGLFAALHAVDATRYTVEASKLAGVRARGWTVEDTWTGESMQWCSGRVQADRLAAEQNRLNADEQAAETATDLDTYVGA